MCTDHCPAEPENALSSIAVFRRVYVNRDENQQVARFSSYVFLPLMISIHDFKSCVNWKMTWKISVVFLMLAVWFVQSKSVRFCLVYFYFGDFF